MYRQREVTAAEGVAHPAHLLMPWIVRVKLSYHCSRFPPENAVWQHLTHETTAAWFLLRKCRRTSTEDEEPRGVVKNIALELWMTAKSSMMNWINVYVHLSHIIKDSYLLTYLLQWWWWYPQYLRIYRWMFRWTWTVWEIVRRRRTDLALGRHTLGHVLQWSLAVNLPWLNSQRRYNLPHVNKQKH